jgi:hypothetical protein
MTGIEDDTHRLLAEANLLRIRKQLDEAIALCTRVLRLDPANATAHSLMGDIHRDEGNFREALGWFKLAVQLNPDSHADLKKLDEMIDRVFPGGKQQAMSADEDTADAPETPATTTSPLLALPATLREVLAKITPTQVIIASTVLAIVVMGTILLVYGRHAHPSTTTTPMVATEPNGTSVDLNTPAAGASDGQSTTPDTTPSATTPTPVTTPTSPAVTPTPTVSNKDTGSTIPPFLPQARPPMSADQLAQVTEQIRVAMKDRLNTLKLKTTLIDVNLNPATNVLTIKYEVPLLKGPIETKEGLLYAGFELIWVADDHPPVNIVRYSLNGFAHLAAGQPAQLAVTADISPQQATDARSASDYGAVAKEMSNVWWHDEIANADL